MQAIIDNNAWVSQRAPFGQGIDHRLLNATYPVLKHVDGEFKLVDEPALSALNMRLRDDYVKECARGIERWNKVISAAGVDFRLELPHVAFNRKIGVFADKLIDPEGKFISGAEYDAGEPNWLPSHADGDFIQESTEGVPALTRFPPTLEALLEYHVIVFGDEWITYDSEWSQDQHPEYQVEQFWLNIFKWLSPSDECQVPIVVVK